MKQLILLTIVLSCILFSRNVLADSKEIVDNCMQENGVTSQELDDARTGKMKPEDVKDNMKCAVQCVLVSANLMDANGDLQLDEFKKAVANTPMQATVEKAINACKDVKGANPCDTAFQIIGCLEALDFSLENADI